MHFQRKNLSNGELVHIYRCLLLPRMIEEKMLLLLRQGKISKWFSGIGQEAVAVGAAMAMDAKEWIMPLHRNLGVFTGRNLPLRKLFMQWQGSPQGYTKGRDRSFHFGSREHYICGMISLLGPQLAVACGTALAHRLDEMASAAPLKASLAFTGEGGTSEGDFHEAMNLAAVWDLPVIFLVENNGYGLSTPVHEQYRCASLADKARGYGMEGVQIDGNNILEVIDTLKGVREYCIRHRKPYLVECITFRMRGHEESSGTRYVPPQLLEEWKHKDPIDNYEAFLLREGVITGEDIEAIKEAYKRYIEEELDHTDDAETLVPDITKELEDVYAPLPSAREMQIPPELAETGAHHELRFVDAIQEALSLSMEHHPRLVLMGQDIAEYGGAFKVTEGLLEKFGKHRVRNTPLCESAVIGAALGLSLEGYKSMVEMQFADFVSAGFNQIVNNLARIHYRWAQPAGVVIRMPTGGTVGAGPFHSQSNEAWFVHTPGLKVVYPSSPEDAKGLLLAAFNDPNPVMFFEHKALYRSITGPVPAGYYEIPIGKARTIQSGNQLSIITYGMGVHWALEYAEQHPDVSLHITDLRTLLPLDYAAIQEAVAATGKVLVLHEGTLTGGVGAEISAWITEHCFEWLDAPVMRLASLDTPVPFNATLEKNFMPRIRMKGTIQKLLAY